MKIGREELANCLIYQIGALKGFLEAEGMTLNHIKPHGSLYGMAARDEEIAHAVCDAADVFKVPLLGMIGTLHETIYPARGHRFIAEFYADLDYDDDGGLIITREHEAKDPRSPPPVPARDRARARCAASAAAISRSAPIRSASIPTRRTPSRSRPAGRAVAERQAVRRRDLERERMPTSKFSRLCRALSIASPRRTSRRSRRRATRSPSATSIGLIEVMKSFIEVHADAAGKIVKFLVDNEEPVMAGQPLRRVDLSMAISRLLIANRGEIAVRIQRAARELGMTTIQVHSAADADSLAVKMADEAVEHRAAAGRQVLSEHRRRSSTPRDATGADAVHPGYGFLSENADFADAVEAAGLVFVGPTGATIRTMGDKAAARERGAKAGVPDRARLRRPRRTILDEARGCAGGIGYPVMIKAAAGGGGRGIRVAQTRRGARSRRSTRPSAEAKAAFGDGGLYLEKFIARARHIEVQILGDGATAIHCYERECSLQRRRQKVWEEAPAPCLAADVARSALRLGGRARPDRSAIAAPARSNISTTKRRGEFYFIEMNTRIQVEHPVTEMITGVDLVREMIRIAGGEPLRLPAERHALPRPCDRSAHQRRRPRERFPPVARHGHGAARSRRRRHALRHAALCRLRGLAVLRFAARQADRLGRNARRGARASCAARSANCTIEGIARRRPLHQALARDAGCRAPAPFTRGGSSMARRDQTPRDCHEGGQQPMASRYSFGGDEHIFVECDEEMSLEAFFKSLSITKAVRESRIKGVTEICPANASFQIKFDPDVIAPDDCWRELQVDRSRRRRADTPRSKTRIIEIPVLYNDPWTHETLMRFRDRHQAPDMTDIEYTAEINHLDGVDGFVKAHSGAPWFVSMVGFVAGLPFLYQMVERQRQIQSPKYLRPRTDTPKLTVGHGGCFGCIYSVRGAGGYQMFGITPMPIYDPNQQINYLSDFMCLFNPGRHRQMAADRARRIRSRPSPTSTPGSSRRGWAT